MVFIQPQNAQSSGQNGVLGLFGWDLGRFRRDSRDHGCWRYILV
jgi:hypothetical protein